MDSRKADDGYTTCRSFFISLPNPLTSRSRFSFKRFSIESTASVSSSNRCENENEYSDEELIESSPLLHPESGKHLTLSYDGSQASEEYNSDCFFESIDLSPLQPLAFVISIGLWCMYQGIKTIFSCIGATR